MEDYNHGRRASNRLYGGCHPIPLISVIPIVRHPPQWHSANPMRMLIGIHRFIMSKTAKGSFRGFGNNFSGIFHLDGYSMLVTGAFTQSMQQFNVSNASVTYNVLNDFNGPYTIEVTTPPSFIGIDTINIKFTSADGGELRVTGNVRPTLDQRHTAIGTGRWTVR